MSRKDWFKDEINEEKTGIWDGFVTIITGYSSDDTLKAVRFIQIADGTDKDEFISLKKCRELIGETDKTITVMFEDGNHGEIYRYGNEKPYEHWQLIGETGGYW